jgi:hypothetical protein
MNAENKEYKTLEEFWPFYLSEHSHPVNRRFHFIGSFFALFFILSFVISLEFAYLLFALFIGYGFAWIGHFVIEKNRPATFKYPFKSFVSDWKLFYYTLTFQIDKELKKFNIQNK